MEPDFFEDAVRSGNNHNANLGEALLHAVDEAVVLAQVAAGEWLPEAMRHGVEAECREMISKWKAVLIQARDMT